MKYEAYLTKKTSSNRKLRKSERSKIFVTNKLLAAKLRKKRRLARKEERKTLE